MYKNCCDRIITNTWFDTNVILFILLNDFAGILKYVILNCYCGSLNQISLNSIPLGPNWQYVAIGLGITGNGLVLNMRTHDDVIQWKHFPRYWPFVRGIHRSPANSPHKGQWREALMFSLICARINGWVKNREAGDLRRHRAHCDVTVTNQTQLMPS